MSSVRVTCPECGNIELKAEKIKVFIRDDENLYSFTCPEESHIAKERAGRGVGRFVLKSAAPHTVLALDFLGCEFFRIMPESLPDPSALSAPSIEDIAIDMHFASENAVWQQAVDELRLDPTMQA